MRITAKKATRYHSKRPCIAERVSGPTRLKQSPRKIARVSANGHNRSLRNGSRNGHPSSFFGPCYWRRNPTARSFKNY